MSIPDNATPVGLPENIHGERLTAELGAIGLGGIGWSRDQGGYVIHDDAPSVSAAQIQAVLDAHAGQTRAELDRGRRERRLDKVSKRELLEALLDPTKVEAIRQKVDQG